MMISFMVILSFAPRPISSLSVQGSLSTLDDDTVSIDLFANKSNDVDKDVDKLVGKLQATGRIRLTIDLAGKMISIHQNMLGADDRIDHYRNQLMEDIGTSLKNPVDTEMASHAKNNASLKSNASLKKSDSTDANVVGAALKETFCRTLYKRDFHETVISQTCSINLLPVDEEDKRDTNGNYSKTRLRYNTTIGNEIAPEMEMRILRHPATMIDVGDNYPEEVSVSREIKSAGRAHKKNESTIIASNLINDDSALQVSRDEDLLVIKTNPPAVLPENSGKGRTFKYNAFATQFDDLEKKSGISKDTAVSPDEGVNESIREDEQREAPTNRELPASLREDMMNVSRISSRGAFQARTPWGKDQNVSSQSDVSGIKVDRVSAMDEILEAVYQVLPTEKPAKISSSESEVISGVS